jgi:DNA invertase Pin-like site-specific DNA recombinase
MIKYLALYCRISKDKRGRVEGVRNQEKWGREYAERTWPGVPMVVFADNDISAFDEAARRPRFEALREAIGRGEVAHVWAVSQSRVSRSYAWFDIAKEMKRAGLEELHTRHDGIVRVRDTMAGFKAVMNVGEVEDMLKRLNDRLAENAVRGLPAGSRPYGYTHGVTDRGEKTYVIVPAEAEVIREAAELVLSGWSLSSIAAGLRARGLHGPHRVKVVAHQCGTGDRRKKCGCPVVTVDGTPVEDGGLPVTRASTLTNMSVRSWMTNPTVAGFRVHKDEQVGKGNWQPILDEGTWRAVRNRLAAPRVVQRSDGGTYPITPTARITGRRYLLTGGTAQCGECHAPMAASMKQFSRKLADGTRKMLKVAPYYLCHSRKGGRSCVGIMGDQFEQHVVAKLLDELDKPEFRQSMGADESAGRRDAITTALDALDAQRVDLAKMWAARKLSAAEWTAAREGLTEEEQRLRSELATVAPLPSSIDWSQIRRSWGAMVLDERRDVISMCINRVVVARAKPGTRGFDEGRVDIQWRPE